TVRMLAMPRLADRSRAKAANAQRDAPQPGRRFLRRGLPSTGAAIAGSMTGLTSLCVWAQHSKKLPSSDWLLSVGCPREVCPDAGCATPCFGTEEGRGVR